jgi:hypothetical protein
MSAPMPMSKLGIARPARYRILIQGWLDKQWQDRLGGLTIETRLGENDVPVTRLTGEVMDQAALLGVLNALFQLQLPLISVTYLDDESD